jgi:hypothetical protein
MLRMTQPSQSTAKQMCASSAATSTKHQHCWELFSCCIVTAFRTAISLPASQSSQPRDHPCGPVVPRFGLQGTSGPCYSLFLCHIPLFVSSATLLQHFHAAGVQCMISCVCAMHRPGFLNAHNSFIPLAHVSPVAPPLCTGSIMTCLCQIR